MFGMNIGRGGSYRFRNGLPLVCKVNSKHEIRNTKQIQNTNDQITKSCGFCSGRRCLGVKL